MNRGSGWFAHLQDHALTVGCILVAITLPFSVRFNSYAMVSLAAVWLLGGDWKNRYKQIWLNRYAVFFCAFYFLHVIGLIYSENLRQGFFELEKRAAFVIFPLVLSTIFFRENDKSRMIIGWFVTACFVASMICLVNGMYYYIKGDSSYLFYHKLTAIINFNHAIYFSFYIGFCVFFLAIQLKDEWGKQTLLLKISRLALTLYFLVFLILLSSKTIIIAVFLLLVFFTSKIILERKGKIWGAAAVVSCILLLSLLLATVPNIRHRFEEVFTDKYKQQNVLLLDDYSGYHFTGGAIRLAIWKTVIEVINAENAWITGVGTGDSQDRLTTEYVRRNFYPGDQTLGAVGFLHYNAHNQFLQFFLMFGIIGLACFICLLTILFQCALRHKDVLFICFLLLFVSFCLTESVLHVQKGIVFFSLFSALLYARNRSAPGSSQ